MEWTGILFQPVPWSPATKRGMPAEYERYLDDPAYTVINVPPNFMFKAGRGAGGLWVGMVAGRWSTGDMPGQGAGPVAAAEDGCHPGSSGGCQPAVPVSLLLPWHGSLLCPSICQSTPMQAKIFKPPRLCTIYKRVTEEQPASVPEAAA